MTERDRRQLERASERLALFTGGKISLRVLIADLEFLLANLEGVPASLSSELREKWGALEEVYSVALDRNAGKLKGRARSIVRDTVTALRERIAELLRLHPEPDGLD